MKFLNIGGLELIFILVIVLLVLGPQDLARSARALGRWLQRLRSQPVVQDLIRTSAELRNFPERIMEETGLEETVQTVNRVSRDLQQDARQAGSSLWSVRDREEQVSVAPPSPPHRQEKSNPPG